MAKDGNADRVMAAHLKASGYPHGRRRSTAARGSGGLANDYKATGSAAYQRRMNKDGK